MKEHLKILIKEKSEEGVLRLIMNNLDQRNALSESMMSILIDEIKDASSDQSIKVIVLAANGNVFCSGHDLKEITAARENDDSGEAYFKNLFDSCSLLMQLIVNTPKPFIAEVDGVATAAGCQLVASCDLAIASHESKFATPGVNIGLFCSTPMVALSRNVNKKNAMEMLLTGDFINAEKAKEIGLINNMVEKEELTFEVNRLAEKIASKSSMTVSIGKNAFYSQTEMDLSEAYKYTSKIMRDNLLKHDAKEGVNAFIEKRSPTWKDE
jgi:enoyl-CoA hydratase/carnithine racemase|tara:strand:- start:989 stop:1792 length:804 start_codon:yes stop_codon:yes gene_type:complete